MRWWPVASGVAVAVAMLVSFAWGASATSPAERWVVRDLGTLGGVSSNAVAVNDRGQVVGTSRAANGVVRVFLWQDGVMRDIGRYGWDVGGGGPILLNERGQVAWNEKGRGGTLWEHGVTRKIPFSPFALNDRGQVVGAARSGNGELHAALWKDGALRDLGVLPAHQWSRAMALNRSGVVVGDSFARDSADSRAFIWQKGRMRDLGVLPGFRACAAVAINDEGQVLGYCAAYGRSHAFLWEQGKIRDLAWSGPEFVLPVFMSGRGHLSNRGQIILWTRERARSHVLLWEHGKARELGWPGSESIKWATDLNERGQIVGNARLSARLSHAVVWEDGTVTDIAGGRWSMAADVNNHGQIAGTRGTGQSLHGDRVVHAALWTRPSTR